LASVSDKGLKAKKGEKKSDIAKEVGKLIAKKAVENKIETVIFDRAGVIYHGRIKALAEGAREGGLKF
jgi:large subunit ribosomal protein L18